MWKGTKFLCLCSAWILFMTLSSERSLGKSEIPAGEETRIPVRVFRDGKAVQGLENLSFSVLIDGMERKVTGIKPLSFKLEKGPETESRMARTVALVLNIATSQEILNPIVEKFLENCLGESDRIMVVTNHFMIPLRHTGDKGELSARIGNLIETELDWQSKRLYTMKTEMDRFIRRFRQAVNEIDGQIGETTSFFEMEFPRFMEIYIQFIQDYRGRFLQVTPDSLKYMEKILEKQDGTCWVVTFFQRGGLPQIKSSAQFMKTIQNTMRNYMGGDSEMRGMSIWDRMMDLQEKTGQMQDQLNDASAFQLNTGKAVWHLFFFPATFHESFLQDEFEWKAVKLQAELALAAASRKTGGILVDKSDAVAFIQQISTRMEPYYELSLEPGGKKIQPDSSVQIIIKDGNPAACETVRLAMDSRTGTGKAVKEVRVKDIGFEKKIFSFSIENFQSLSANGETKGRIEVRLQIVNEKLEAVLNNRNEFTVHKEGEAIQIRFPKLKKGKYDVILTVTDLGNQTSDMIVYPVQI